MSYQQQPVKFSEEGGIIVLTFVVMYCLEEKGQSDTIVWEGEKRFILQRYNVTGLAPDVPMLLHCVC